MANPLLREDDKKRETIDPRDLLATRLHKLLGKLCVGSTIGCITQKSFKCFASRF